MAAKGKIVIDKEICKGCKLCTLVCPYKLIAISNDFNSKSILPAVFSDNSEKCTGCKICYEVCPDVAIGVFKMIKKDKKAPETGKEE